MADVRIDTAKVAETATRMSALNKKLDQLLKDSQSNIKSLSASWDGTASDDTRRSYDTFAQKYFAEYYDVVEDYVRFLNSHVEEGYVATEVSNEDLATLYK